MYHHRAPTDHQRIPLPGRYWLACVGVYAEQLGQLMYGRLYKFYYESDLLGFHHRV
jgi:hypothetical protein